MFDVCLVNVGFFFAKQKRRGTIFRVESYPNCGEISDMRPRHEKTLLPEKHIFLCNMYVLHFSLNMRLAYRVLTSI